MVVVNSRQLRNNKKFNSNPEITYEIEKNGEREFISESDLKLHKTLFGKQSLRYHSDFDKSPKRDFKI